MDSPARPSQPKMASSTGGTEGSSPASSPASAASLAAMAAPKYGTLVPNRIFVGGISASTSEAELAQLFSAYGNVKATKIIADRGGVSKGYGFVTFETEEEAKRLQQESEGIMLRERKLNIAPAIKKQPFNRSFDGGTGSPPAVPTSTYYYANGMGLPYQNGVTFYNTGAPAPGAAIAPPTDPTALYQAAGVFGPQATAGHQTFAPVMYPVPAPSLYMPQQYQYSPMPYEPYFPGTTAAGAPQFLYTTNGAQATTSGSGNGLGNSNNSAIAAGATSPASAAPGQFPGHFYGPAGAGSHPHPGTMAGGPHGPPPPPPPQMEHLYYSYPTPSHTAQASPHHGGSLALSSDQQLLVYTEIAGQSSANDSGIGQEEAQSSSHSDQLQQVGGTATTSDTGGGVGQQPADHTAPTMLPFMPLKYPVSNRYPNFHPITIHSQQLHSQQATANTSANDPNPKQPDDAVNNSPVHYRVMSVYPTPPYMYHPAGSSGNGGASLLPTPPQQPYDLGSGKFRDYSKSAGGNMNAQYTKAVSANMHQQSAYAKQYNGPPLQPPPPHLTGSQKYNPAARMSHHHHHHHHHQYGKRVGPAGPSQQQHHPLANPPAYYMPHKSANSRSSQQQTFFSPYASVPPHHHSNLHKSFPVLGPGYEYANSGRRSISSPDSHSKYVNRKTANFSNSRASSAPATSGVEPNKTGVAESSAESATTASSLSVVTTTTTTSSNSSSNANSSSSNVTTSETESNANTNANTTTSSNSSPTPMSFSPMTRPHPNLSPSPNQVQFFGANGQQRYGGGGVGGSGLQRAASGGRYPMSTLRSGGGKGTGSILRQNSGTGKYKMNGIVQSSGKLPSEELGGAGDAQPLGRLPLTPPTTPQQNVDQQGQQINDTCHQMQALSL